ncbi:MAG: TonB C-terminal domain-containing protein [Acidobacteria bacterium]|nr:TonB C-terminal domain-containing protein [Acidobacteriota bacterium]
MYFNFEDYRPDIELIDSAISRREGVLLSIVVHALVIALVLLAPRLPLFQRLAEQRARALEQQRQLALEQQRNQARFVFVQPRVDLEAKKPPVVGELSDKDRVARAPERSVKPRDSRPFSRGNSSDRVEAQRQARAQGQGPAPEAASPQPGSRQEVLPPIDDNGRTAVARGSSTPAPHAGQSGGSLGDALRNLERFVEQENFSNEQGGGGTFGPSIQFDTKGVEFGPWIRRFVAQIKRNWFIPYAAMSLKGHVAITFYVHKDGAISALNVVAPCDVEAFNHSAFNALTASNPTQPLPPEYPSDRAFFTVTFYYNETPPVSP